MTEAQHDDQLSGKKAVRELLLQRLTDAGLKRPRGVTAEAQARSGEALAAQLSYMDPENLMTLADLVIAAAADGVMPSEWLIRKWAHQLEAPPPSDRRIITSWLASKAGPPAEAGGYLVELYRWLIRHPRPVSEIDLKQIQQEARDNNRRMQIISERVSPTAEDLAWREAWVRDQAAAQRIVDEGCAKRARAPEAGAA